MVFTHLFLSFLSFVFSPQPLSLLFVFKCVYSVFLMQHNDKIRQPVVPKRRNSSLLVSLQYRPLAGYSCFHICRFGCCSIWPRRVCLCAFGLRPQVLDFIQPKPYLFFYCFCRWAFGDGPRFQTHTHHIRRMGIYFWLCQHLVTSSLCYFFLFVISFPCVNPVFILSRPFVDIKIARIFCSSPPLRNIFIPVNL